MVMKFVLSPIDSIPVEGGALDATDEADILSVSSALLVGAAQLAKGIDDDTNEHVEEKQRAKEDEYLIKRGT